MSNRRRGDYPGAFHHIVNRGTAQTMIYRSPSDRRAFLSLLGGLDEDFDIRTVAYALMGNHYHVLARSVAGRLSEAMQYLDGRYAQLFNARHDRVGALFQGRFRSERVETDSQLHRTGVYIHLNPLRAGLETSLGEWRWSSLGSYLRGSSALPWLHLDLLGGTEAGHYRSNLLAHAPEVTALEGDPDPGRIDWIESEETEAALASADRLVAGSFGVSVDDLYQVVRGRPNVPRLVAIALAAQVANSSIAAIASRYGLRRSSGVHAARQRLRARLDRDPRLLRHVVHLGLQL